MAKGKYEYWLTDDGLTLLKAWARNGLTDEQIASNMNISTSSLYNYKNEHLEILEALKKGKEVVDIEVENALLKRALGYEYTEQKIELENGKKKVTQTIKHISPDVGAAAFWLKNRQGAKWRDKHEIQDNDGVERLDALLEEFKNAVK